MASKKVSFTTADGERVSFTASGKKKRGNPKRKLTPWNKYVKKNMSRTMRDYECDAPTAMSIMAEEFHD